MSSTPISCTSDYYSGSDFDYDDEENDDVVKAAPSHYSSTKETNIILRTLFQQQQPDHQPSADLTSTIKVQHSIRLLTLAQVYHLHDEVFIRAHGILHKYLLSTCTNDVDESILMACLSLSTKLSQHSSLIPFQHQSLLSDEDMLSSALDWDIDIVTSINYVEAILLDVMHHSMKDRVRQLTYELIVLCLTDVRCVDLPAASLAIGCLLMASELCHCCEIIPRQLFTNDREMSSVVKTSLMYTRQVLIQILGR